MSNIDEAQLNFEYGLGADQVSGTTLRRQAIDEIRNCVCRDRNAAYGDAEDNFAVIARFWTEYLGHEVTSLDVAAMMILMKVARIKHDPQHQDSWIDAGGYAVCGAGIVKRLAPKIASLTGASHSERIHAAVSEPAPDPQSAQSNESKP